MSGSDGSSSIYVGITAASFTVTALTIFTLFYFLWSCYARRRLRARAAHYHASSGMFFGAMRAPENIMNEWLRERGICKDKMDSLCPRKRLIWKHDSSNDVVVENVGEDDIEQQQQQPLDQVVKNEVRNDNNGDEKNCVICLEEMENGCIVRELPCEHVFHSRCIEVWLAKASRCPICNSVLAVRNPEAKCRHVLRPWLQVRESPISISFARSANEALRANERNNREGRQDGEGERVEVGSEGGEVVDDEGERGNEELEKEQGQSESIRLGQDVQEINDERNSASAELHREEIT